MYTAMKLELVIIDGPQAGKRLPVGEAPRTFGRSASSEVSFPDDNFISGVHMSVQADPVGVLVTDMRSTNGTFLNGKRITQAVAEIGDVLQIGTLSLQVTSAQPPAAPVFSSSAREAGRSAPTQTPAPEPPALPRMDVPAPPSAVVSTTTIPRIFVTPPAASPPGATPRSFEPKPAHEAALAVLAAERVPLFALVNAEADETLSSWLVMSGFPVRQHTLWEGEPGASAPGWAPFLLSLTPGSPALHQLLENGWGKGWASYFTSSAALEDLRAHFSRFLMTQLQGKGEVYFRFYEPTVMREFLTQANPNELAMFFGPVNEWLLEAPVKGSMLRVRNSPGGLVTNTVSLTEGGTVASPPAI
jgi:hypothetical protein